MKKRLSHLKRFIFNKGDSDLRYWKKRAKAFGKRSVFNIGHSDQETDSVTELQKQEIYPVFKYSLRGDERIVLDFGCGYGRFTEDLANMISGKAIGIDPIESLITIPDNNDAVQFMVMEETSIPLPDQSVDIVWICLVLGCITDEIMLQKTIGEINRVLKEDGLLFLVENTSELDNKKHYHYSGVDVYMKMFPLISLEHLHDYFDLGERISIMAGRKIL